MNYWKPIALLSIVGMVLSVGIQVSSAGGECRGQAHMGAAVRLLRDARNELRSAEHNKGGWREAAIDATDKAIREAERGCEYANQ